MSCCQRIATPEIVMSGHPTSVGDQYLDYRFSNLREVTVEEKKYRVCDGVRYYPLRERVGRAVAGVLLTLLTGFFGLLSPQIRSLFHAEQRVTILHDPQETKARMGLSNGQIVFFTHGLRVRDPSEIDD